MGRPVIVASAGAMYLALYCWLVCVSIAPYSVAAADLDIYPEFADEIITRRIQQMLMELRERQLRIQQERVPPFTYHFPENPSGKYQRDLFAVPPSDPRYYQPDADVVVGEEKRQEEDGSVASVSKSESGQLGAPKTKDEETQTDEVTSETNESSAGVKEGGDVSDVIKKILANNDHELLLFGAVAACAAAAAIAVIALFIGWYRLHSNSKAAADIEYPAYGVTGPNKEITPTGDRRLAQSAQMYHYQHQKQQIIAMESNRANNERRGSVSEGDSDEENEEGDYTVYECPGLAATGELEVKNPLFLDDPTPAATNHTEKEPPSPADKIIIN